MAKGGMNRAMMQARIVGAMLIGRLPCTRYRDRGRGRVVKLRWAWPCMFTKTIQAPLVDTPVWVHISGLEQRAMAWIR